MAKTFYLSVISNPNDLSYTPGCHLSNITDSYPQRVEQHWDLSACSDHGPRISTGWVTSFWHWHKELPQSVNDLSSGVSVGESCAISTSDRKSEWVREQEIQPRRRRSLCLGVLLMLAHKWGKRECIWGKERERETHIYESCPVAAGPSRFCRLIEIPPYCSLTVAKQSQRTAAPTHNAADSLTGYCCAGQWVCSFTWRECKREPNPQREKESMMEGFMDLRPG